MWEKLLPQVLQYAGQHVHIAGSASGFVVAGAQAVVNAAINANDLQSIVPIIDDLLKHSVELRLTSEQTNAIHSVRQDANASEHKPSVLSGGLSIFKEIAVATAKKAAENAVPEHLWPLLHDRLSNIITVISQALK